MKILILLFVFISQLGMAQNIDRLEPSKVADNKSIVSSIQISIYFDKKLIDEDLKGEKIPIIFMVENTSKEIQTLIYLNHNVQLNLYLLDDKGNKNIVYSGENAYPDSSATDWPLAPGEKISFKTLIPFDAFIAKDGRYVISTRRCGTKSEASCHVFSKPFLLSDLVAEKQVGLINSALIVNQ